MRLEEIALSMSACSRKTLSRCGACLVKSSCLPRASPRSAKYQAVVVGMFAFFESSRRVSIVVLNIVVLRKRFNSIGTEGCGRMAGARFVKLWRRGQDSNLHILADGGF